MSRTTATLEHGIDQIKTRAVETADHGTERVASAAGKVSDTLRDTAKRVDQPAVSKALKSSSKAVRSTEKQLRSQGAAGLATMLWASMKTHPGRYMLLAITLGLMLGRSTKRRTNSDTVGTGSVMVVEVKEVR
jgi:hypothetical protein